MTFRDRWQYELNDPSIRLFDFAVQDGWIELPDSASILELGCCESDWAKWMKAADRGGFIAGVDVNHCDYAGDQFQMGDASGTASWFFTPVVWNEGKGIGYTDTRRWDAVVALGSLEHFGLGFYGDPIREDADIVALKNAANALKPGGLIFYDVPWTPYEHYITENRHFRVYDDASLQARLTPSGCSVLHQAWALPENPPPSLIFTKPTTPMQPFWYCVRVLRKDG